MTITGQSSLDKDTIAQMVKDAEAHAEEDRVRRDEAEVRNTADTLVYQTEKLLKDQADAVSDDERSTIESKLAEIRTTLEGDDIGAIKDATEALMTASQEFGQRLYEAAAQTERESAAAASAPADDEVVDAEIVEDEGEDGEAVDSESA